MITEFRYPFGLPVLTRRPEISEPRPLFVLGAYPSAFHVCWKPPSPYKPIQAIAVDNEPDFFWDGQNEKSILDAWLNTVRFLPTWGSIEPARKLNGSSGAWVNRNVLSPLNMSRQKTWMTDCLDQYRCSIGLAVRLQDTYQPLADKFELPSPKLQAHPDENTIVNEAIDHHRTRLINELTAAQPELVVTLGNAALRVFRKLISMPPEEAPTKLSHSEQQYGVRVKVKLETAYIVDWLPLSHPAAPQPYQQAHERWSKSM